MVARHGPCDMNRLRAFLDAPPSEEGSCDLAEHLEHCEKCRRDLEAMAGGQWWSEVRPLVRGEPIKEANILTEAGHVADSEESDLSFLTPPEQPGELGRFGPYQVLGVLGQGGMGIVLKAWEPALRRTVAIKVLAPVLATNGAARQRFTREAQAAAAVMHTHVIAIHSVDTDKTSGLPYLVMPCIAGRSLQERIDRDGALDITAVLRIGMQAAQGLAAAHAQGIVHRDVKPANILLENGVERVVLTDFGLARVSDDASLTQSGVIAGTPQYMSPEQACGEPTDHRSDLFSLGSVLYAMCTGRPPFRAPSALAVLRRVADEEPRPVREVNPAVPEALAAVIEKLHAKEPADRYQTAAEVAAVLGQLLAGVQRPAPATAKRVASRAAQQPRCRRWKEEVLAGVAVLAVGLLLAWAFLGHRNWPSSPAATQNDAAVLAGDLKVLAHDANCAECDNDDPDEPDEHPGHRIPAIPAIPAIPPVPAIPGVPTIPPIPPIPPIKIDIPLGPLVLLDKCEGKELQVVFGNPEDTIVGSGKSQTKTYDNIKDFTAVEVRGPFTVELKQGKDFHVAVTADDNLFEHLQVEKSGSKLEIGFKGKNLRLRLSRDNPLKVAITMPSLEALDLNGAVTATADGFEGDHPLRLHLNGASQLKGSVRAAEVTVDVNGASTVKLAGSGKNIRLKSNGASRLKLSEFDASGERLIIDATGASIVSLKGSVTASVIRATGACHLDLHGTTLAAADVTLEGASQAKVHVTEKLDYSVGGASHLDYTGDPKIGRSSKHGASHVSHKK